MTDLTPKQIGDALSEEEQRLLGNAEAMCNENIDNEYDSMVCDALKSLAACHIENKRLKDGLKEVMGWIDNWDPNFADDDEWPETADKITALLATPEGGSRE